jgi:hypothetical protein
MPTARRLATLMFLFSCVLVADAEAAGAPVPTAVTGRVGVVAAGGDERYLAVRSGSSTVVRAVARSGGRVLRSRRIAGRWTIPAVTIFGGTTGLSADGRTLVLARPTRSYPPASSPLAVLDARTLRVRREIPLGGFFTVDAVSPDGRWAYVIQYKDANGLDYRVRALDLASGSLAARDVVDPRKPGEKMGGIPMRRLMSPDGRWAYTLYGGGSETFIHALDTVGRTAACIDLDMLRPDADFSDVRLALSGGSVLVRNRQGLVATVDRTTFAVSEPAKAAAAPPPAAARRPAPSADDGGFPWTEVLLVAAGLCAIGLGAARALSGPRAESPPRA